jgi:hypothetical protein
MFMLQQRATSSPLRIVPSLQGLWRSKGCDWSEIACNQRYYYQQIGIV